MKSYKQLKIQKKKSVAPRSTLRDSSGFSLFETLVAVFILSLAVASALTSVHKSLQSSFYARDQLVASFLAQDALEFIRNVRDNNTIAILGGSTDTGWLDGVEEKCGASCRVDTTASGGLSNQVRVCTGDCLLEPLAYSVSSGLYGYDIPGAHHQGDFVPTRFYRSVHVEPLDTFADGVSKEVAVKVTVTWKTGSLPERTYVLSENLLNWGKQN